MTLEEYFKHEAAEGKIDYHLRCECWDGKVHFYVHPLGRDGLTTPNLQIVDDHILWPDPNVRSES